ncbi:hypothetical protein FoTM2_017231 [Fusarium oxysporum f. sp. vasinfectum]|nr:hypothetical protein FoTM2_017231 [Fusarium oxysporum f. sp. vasinfectum]
MSIWRERRNKAIFLSQRAYVEKVLREFDMSESKPVATPLNTSRFQPVPDEYNASEATKLWMKWEIWSTKALVIEDSDASTEYQTSITLDNLGVEALVTRESNSC